MQRQWLHEQISQSINKSWNPEFSLPSTLNWMHALAHEIEQEHGTRPVDQFVQLRSHFISKVTPLERKSSLTHHIFGSLFHALTFSLTLTSMVESQPCRPWMFPTAIIAWYYATYNAFRSVVAASGTTPPDNHTGLQRCLFGTTIRPKLPHPFDMVATYEHNEDYKSLLPYYPETVSEKLEQTFISLRPQSQGMLLAYLNGTTTWEVEDIKPQLKRDLKVNNFRTKGAQQARNERLKKKLPEINFLHCAFRYRGKANYRDSIFLAYGREDSRISIAFIESLETSARFAFLCGLAYAERRIGKDTTKDFLVDLSHHFRGQVQATPRERIWDVILLGQY